MVDKIEDAIRKYYALIIAVAGIVTTAAGALYVVINPIHDNIARLDATVAVLRSDLTANAAADLSFRTRADSNRYTEADAHRDQNPIRDDIQELKQAIRELQSQQRSFNNGR